LLLDSFKKHYDKVNIAYSFKTNYIPNFLKIVKNKELWMQLDNLINKHNVTWKWVKGHAGFEFNEKADELARKYIESYI